MFTVDSVEVALLRWDGRPPDEELTELLTTVAARTALEPLFGTLPALRGSLTGDFAEWLTKAILRLVERAIAMVKRLGGTVSFALPLATSGLTLTVNL